MRRLFVVLALTALVASIPTMAAQGDQIIRFGGAYVTPTGDWTISDEDEVLETATLEADSAFGPFFGFEYMISEMVGIDATVMSANHDIDSDYTVTDGSEVLFSDCMTIGDVTVTPIFVSAHFHVMQREAMDMYVGPTIGYILYGDLKLNPEFGEDNVALKNDFGYGGVVGLDVPFGSAGWNFSTALRYVVTAAQLDDPEAPDIEIDINPIILQVGVGKRW
jgi:outer membrane protein W